LGLLPSYDVKCTIPMSASDDFWTAIPDPKLLDSEANVEHRLVLPMLHALGYQSDDIESKYPVEFQQGRVGRKPEADFVCFDGLIRNRTNTLLVVEVKASHEPLGQAKAQGESYAQNLRAPFLVVTNGLTLEIWQIQITLESSCVLQTPVSRLLAHRSEIERLLNKTAVRSYCVTLEFKNILESTKDFRAYETAELARLKKDSRSITRTMRPKPTVSTLDVFPSNQILDNYSSGAVIIGASGYGKTTLSRSIFRQAIEGRCDGRYRNIAFEVPLPDLDESGTDLIVYLHQRLVAHQLGFTIDAFRGLLREFGCTIICDSLDRTSLGFQKRLPTIISLFLRDYPQSQVFVFTRAITISIATLPILELQELSPDQVQEIESIVLTEKNTANLSIASLAPLALRSLFNNPLLLRLVLEYWRRVGDFPRNIILLFDSWLESALNSHQDDVVSRTQRRNALSIIAQATSDGPLSGRRALTLLRNSSISESVLNELIQCGTIRETNSVLEVQHDSLADYLRSIAFYDRPVTEQITHLSSLSFSSDSFLPIFLMAQVADRNVHSKLWEHLTSGSLRTYLNSLLYRFDHSDELRRLGSYEFSLVYLTDLLNGVEQPLDGFFPSLRPSIVEWLADETGELLSVVGSANDRSVNYKFQLRQPSQSRVLVDTPRFPGVIRGVDLSLSRYRADSARLLGITLLKDGLENVVKTLNVDGGCVWAVERLISRVRVLARRYEIQLTVNDDLEQIEKAIEPYTDQRMCEGALVGQETFSFQTMLQDIALLRAAGVSSLDPWWIRLGWKGQVSSVGDDELAAILDEEFRRIQLAYKEIVIKSGTVRNSVCGVIIPPKEFGHAPAQTALHSGCPS
jgi:hypothetical protein